MMTQLKLLWKIRGGLLVPDKNDHVEPGIQREVRDWTEAEFPIGDDLVWYEMDIITRDFDRLKQRVEKLGRHMRHTLDNNVKMNRDLLNRVSALTAEIAALKGVTNA